MKVIFVTECSMVIVFLCIAVSCIGQAVSYSTDDASEENVADVTKGSLGMLRLARSLQMLRLGRRSTSDTGDSKKVFYLRKLLHALISQPRDEHRRQPPVPRYGRNLDGLEKAAKDVYLFPEVYRPAPRGGRYRRANFASLPLPQLFLENEREVPLTVRTVVRPRIGRYLEALTPPQESGSETSDPIDEESSSDVLNL